MDESRQRVLTNVYFVSLGKTAFFRFRVDVRAQDLRPGSLTCSLHGPNHALTQLHSTMPNLCRRLRINATNTEHEWLERLQKCAQRALSKQSKRSFSCWSGFGGDMADCRQHADDS